MTKAAKLYYELDMKQVDVAESLQISQTKVSRLLRKANELGLVRTIVTVPSGVNTDVEAQLEQQFGLAEAIVVDDPASPELLLPTLGRATASYLDETLTGRDRVGFSSWSATLLAAVEAMRPSGTRRVAQVVQLVGGVGIHAVQGRANRMLGRLSTLTGADPIYLTAPGLLDTPGAVQSFLADGSMSELVKAWEKLTIALIGIGGPDPSPFYRASGNAISRVAATELRTLGAVGDVLLRYYDITGSLIKTPLNGRVVGIGLDTFRKIPRRIAAAGGPRKAPAILGALRGQWVNVLVTDLQTAETVLKLATK